MNEGMVIVLLILGPLTLRAVGRFLRNRQRLRLQEMAHQERMLALEKGLPVPDVPGGGDFDAWLNEASAERLLEGGWDRRVTLGVGLVMLFASIGGLLVALLLPGDSNDAVGIRMAGWVGIIPLMASFGMLLYYRLTAPKN
jgi:hypothetical protein